MSKHADNIDTLDIALVDILLTGENVAIPDLGQLELKMIADRRTVLFKALKPNDPLMQSPAGKENHFSSVLYQNITVPLQEWQIVSLPKLGIFHPLKKDDGSLRVSFTPAASLRRQLNGEPEPVIVNKTVEPEEELNQGEPVKAIEPEKEKIYPVIVATIPVEKKEEVRPLKAIAPPKEELSPKEVVAPKVTVVPEESRTEEDHPERRESGRKKREHNRSHEAVNVGNTRNRMLLWLCLLAFLIIVAIAFLLITRNKNEQEPVEDKSSVSSLNLPDLANRNYGNPIFWVYIYEANRQKLTSPINIPAEVELVIPDLSQYIDCTDSLEIRKAKAMSDMILRQR